MFKKKKICFPLNEWGKNGAVWLAQRYLPLHLLAPLHPPLNEQWEGPRRRCMLGILPAEAEAHGGLVCVQWCVPHLRGETKSQCNQDFQFKSCLTIQSIILLKSKKKKKNVALWRVPPPIKQQN